MKLNALKKIVNTNGITKEKVNFMLLVLIVIERLNK